jgi:antitoxin MazE
MSTLITIGNSQGIRIPKPMIKQAHLSDVELELVVVKDGLLIKPMGKPSREVWADNIGSILSQHKEKDDGVLENFLDDSDLEDTIW